MTRDIAPFGLRMQAELKERLAEEAKQNRRSLNAEVIARLTRSIDQQDLVVSAGYKVEDVASSYSVVRNDGERSILAIFRRMSSEKQLALLSLFK